jgi:alpha-pyrone synthase
MIDVFINQITTAVPPYDIHQKFINFVPLLLADDSKAQKIFKRMVDYSQISHRYAYLQPHSQPTHLDGQGFYRLGHFPDMQSRMAFFEQYALPLACQAVDKLDIFALKNDITHLIITTCTGFYAPGLDLQLIEHYGLNPSIERTTIGFMGCYAAITGLKTAYHIVRSQPQASVLILNLELCTVHLKETTNLEQLLAFLLFADGCAATLVSAKPAGFCMQKFHCAVLADSQSQIKWNLGSSNFEMVLSGQVPLTIAKQLGFHQQNILGGRPVEAFQHWAIHPGGRSILDILETTLKLPPDALHISRSVLNDYGNMSSATIMFVLARMLATGQEGYGCAMAFGPGVTVETMQFKTSTLACH